MKYKGVATCFHRRAARKCRADFSSESDNFSSDDHNSALEPDSARSPETPPRERNEYKIKLATDLFGCAGTSAPAYPFREKEGNRAEKTGTSRAPISKPQQLAHRRQLARHARR